MRKFPLAALMTWMIINTSIFIPTRVQAGEASLYLSCGVPTILAGFRFTTYKCQNSGISKLSMFNTYKQKRTLVLKGNITFQNGMFLYESDKEGSVVINFEPLQSIALNNYRSSRLTLYPSNDNLSFQRILPLKCQSPTEKKFGFLITPTCNSSRPRFIIENTSSGTQALGYYGSIGKNIKYRNLYVWSRSEQDTLDLYPISRGKKPTSITYKIMTYKLKNYY